MYMYIYIICTYCTHVHEDALLVAPAQLIGAWYWLKHILHIGWLFDIRTSRPEGCLWPRELWFNIHVHQKLAMQQWNGNGVLPVWASAMARVMALLEMALFLWLVSDTSSSLGREGEGFPLPPMLVKAAAWLLKRAVQTSQPVQEGRRRKEGRGRRKMMFNIIYIHCMLTCERSEMFTYSICQHVDRRRIKATTPKKTTLLFPKRKRRPASCGIQIHDILCTRRVLYQLSHRGSSLMNRVL